MLLNDLIKKNSSEKDVFIVSPLVNVIETKNQTIVEVELPGVTKEDIKITLVGEELKIEASRKREVPKGFQTIHQESKPVTFKRVFGVFDDYEKESIEAKHQDGVLTLILNKSAVAQPKKIEIL